MLDVARAVILHAREADVPLVLDGDALFLVAREPELVQGEEYYPQRPNSDYI
jgi:ATP-dependent NAD(P)H-hydrate dehydratase